MKTLQAAVESQKNKMTAISFIETHFNRKKHEPYLPLNKYDLIFHRKECVKFIPVSAKSLVCHCGEEKHSNRENTAASSRNRAIGFPCKGMEI